MTFNKMILGALLVTLSSPFSTVRAEPASPFTGTTPQPTATVEEATRLQNFQALDKDGPGSAQLANRPAIDSLLEMESRVSTVDAAIQLKTQGLQHVTSLSEFALLTSYAFPNPSDAYKAAVQNFTVSYVSSYVRTSADLTILHNLEERMGTIDQAMQIKNAGLAITQNLLDFELLSRSAFPNASEGYLNAQSQFIASNVNGRVAVTDSPLMVIILEARVKTIDQAMQVKEAGMQLVETLEDFAELSKPAFENASEGYQSRRQQFISTNITRAVKPDSDIQTLIQLESQMATIDQAMNIKRAGLVACHSMADFQKLIQPAFPNPSAGYSNALSQFIAQYAGQFS